MPHRCWGSAKLVPGDTRCLEGGHEPHQPPQPCFPKLIPSLCASAAPPIHLFWGGEPQNQCIYFYHYLLLFNEIKYRPEHNLPALTTQEWRSVLGNTVWKKQWPQPNRNNPSTFDPNIFWKYGCSLLFDDECSAAVAVGHYNPTSQLSCHCNIQLGMVDDTDVHPSGCLIPQFVPHG